MIDLLGTFTVFDETGRLFSFEERELAQMFADQAAMALHNAELYEEVRATRDFVRSIVANSADAIMATDISRYVTFLSPSAEEMFGFSIENCLGQPLSMFLRQGEAEVEAIAQRLQYEGRFSNYETQIRTVDHQWVDVDGSLSSLLDDSGKAVGIIGIFKDITERKRNQQALLESEHRFRSVTQSASDAIIAADQNGNIITWNTGGKQIFGYREEEVLGQPLTILMPLRYREAHRESFQRAAVLKRSSLFGKVLELVGLRKSGEEFPIDLSLSNWAVGDNVFFSGIIRDATLRKESEKMIREYNRTLEETVSERTEELQRSKEAAEAANLAKSEFLANISHELRTPLHGLLGYADLGIRRSYSITPEKLQSYFEQIKQSGDSLLVLLNDLLDLAKLESGQMKYSFEMVNVNDLISQLSDEFYSLISEHNVNLLLEIPEELIEIKLDPMRIKQVIRNLLSNALKFSPQHGVIELKLEHEPDGFVISIRDQGIGLPEGELELIFEKFIQSSTTKTGAGGTGLGLAICREIVTAHGGMIWATNHPEGGAILTLTIPDRPVGHLA